MGTDLKRRIITLAVVLGAALLLLLPTIFKGSFPERWISRPISLGLDLSGGVHLVYEVQSAEAVKSRLQGIANSIRSDLRGEKIAVTRARVNERNQVEITLLSAQRAERVKQLVAEDYRDLSFIETGDDSGRVRLVFGVTPDQVMRIEREAITQAIETLRNRVDQFGVAEPLIQKIGEKRILLQMPGVSDIEAVKRVVGSVAKLEFRLLPVSAGRAGEVRLKDRAGASIPVEDDVLMTGDAVDSAHVAVLNGQVEVMLNLTSEGGRTFGRLTSENVGRNLAIILDNVVYSSPVIRDAITGGRATISGGFTMAEAKELAVVLRAGALPAPLVVMEERTVGPSLGKESIQKGVLAILFGFLLVILFMGYYYRKSGWIAVGTLALNMVLILAFLSAFGATLTLPGLAGLALTIGMAVDSNVIIFERIRDELRIGSSRDAAVRAGFDKALSAILDSNITTFLSGAILYFLGTGPIRGFAVTLCVGILTTVFCATFAARLAFDFFELKSSKQAISI